MSDQFVAEIRIFPFNQYAPAGWAKCDGQLMAISQNTALFSLLNMIYGGDGKTTFALPNLIGQVPMFWGQGNGLTDRVIGESGGEAAVTLNTKQIPTHGHVMQAAPAIAAGDTNVIAGNSLAKSSQGNVYAPYSGQSAVQLSASALQTTGNGQAHENEQPNITLCFNIALQGLYPPRS